MLPRIVRGSLLRMRRRTAAAVGAVLVPAAFVTAVSNFLLDARAKMSREMARLGPNLVVTGIDPARLPAGSLRASVPEASAATALARGLLRIEGGEIPLLGFDPPEARRLRSGWLLEGEWPSSGLLLGARLAERLRLRPGDELGGRRIEGVVESGKPADEAAFLPIAEALREGARIEAVELRLPGSAIEVERAGAALVARWGGEARVQRPIAEAERSILERLTLAFRLVGGLVLVACALSMATTLCAGVAERRREIGILRALGAGDARLLRIFGAEGSALLAAGLLPGVAAGFALSAWLGRSVFGEATSVRPLAALAALLACGGIALAGALLALRSALRVEAAIVLREE
ncbi:MAG: FtsX-like permease family protein [Planctomycetes bacterium]|nr:FtsX-like permease family protein [Planctomycetota bacterium]